jgi:tRNA A37 threonylcarbamoyladenosine modification protein TsaB
MSVLFAANRGEQTPVSCSVHVYVTDCVCVCAFWVLQTCPAENSFLMDAIGDLATDVSFWVEGVHRIL